MKKIISTFIIILFLGIVVFTQEDKIRLAVAPFDDSITAAAEREKCGRDVSSLLEKQFMSLDRFYLREAGAIRNYLNNLELVKVGIASANSMRRKSSSLKIDYLTVGTVAKFGSKYEVDARTVNINNWQIVHSHGSSSGSISAAIDDINWYISKKLNKKYLYDRLDKTIRKSTVSVSSFKDYNRKAGKLGFSGAFAEILNSELGSFILIKTIERKYAKALINEKFLEMLGVIENDNSDKDFSRNGIQYKLSGNIRAFNDIVCVNYNLKSTAEGRIVFMGSNEIGGAGALRPFARLLANTVEDVLNNRIGTLKLKTKPSGAKIYIDGDYKGDSPVLISLAKGNHKIKAKMEGYQTEKTSFNVLPKKINKLTIKFEQISFNHMETAMSYEMQKKWMKAVKAYEAFIKKYGETKFANAAYYRIGHVKVFHLKKPKEAKVTFQKLIKRYPDETTRAEAYYGLMHTYKALGDMGKANDTRNFLLNKYGKTYAAEMARGEKF